MLFFRVTDPNGETYEVPATFEQDDFVVSVNNNGEWKLYDAECNNLDNPPEPTGRYVNEELGYYEDNLPNNVELVYEDEDED